MKSMDIYKEHSLKFAWGEPIVDQAKQSPKHQTACIPRLDHIG